MTLVLDIDNFDILLQEYASNSMMVLSQLMDDFRIQSGRRERYYSTLYEENHLPEFRPAEIDNRTYVRMALRDFVYKDTLSLTTCKSLPEILTKCLFPDVDCKDTTIILKKHFDSPPVSRLQAKNLCAFFDGFSAVTLDFDEVDWVSPSFMHQIFVVYQREHPDVYIKPIHMNGPVVNVYRYIIRAAICQS